MAGIRVLSVRVRLIDERLQPFKPAEDVFHFKRQGLTSNVPYSSLKKRVSLRHPGASFESLEVWAAMIPAKNKESLSN